MPLNASSSSLIHALVPAGSRLKKSRRRLSRSSPLTCRRNAAEAPRDRSRWADGKLSPFGKPPRRGSFWAAGGGRRGASGPAWWIRRCHGERQAVWLSLFSPRPSMPSRSFLALQKNEVPLAKPAGAAPARGHIRASLSIVVACPLSYWSPSDLAHSPHVPRDYLISSQHTPKRNHVRITHIVFVNMRAQGERSGTKRPGLCHMRRVTPSVSKHFSPRKHLLALHGPR